MDNRVGPQKFLGEADFEEIQDEEQQLLMGGTGTEVILWPWDLK
jgi:hypothetical protein